MLHGVVVVSLALAVLCVAAAISRVVRETHALSLRQAAAAYDVLRARR